MFDLEEDYEAKYKGGWRPDPYEESSIPVGTLHHMCSYDEMQERERHKRLSRYEVEENSDPPRIDFNKAIKEFKRSSVGREFTSPMDLRPWSVLKHTLNHLLLDICLRDDDWMVICDFVYDRLKAVRQDVVIQRIEGLRYVAILEGSIRFLLYSMYRLTCTYKDYTQTESMQVIVPPEGQVSGLNNLELNIVREMKLTLQCLRECLSSLIIHYQERVPSSPNRALFESINLLINLPFSHGHCPCSTEFQIKRELRNKDPFFRTVFKMFREHLAGYHWSGMKHYPKLADSPLLVLAYAPMLAQLQVNMVQLLKKLYSTQGSNTCSLKHLSALLCPNWLESDEEKRIKFAKFVAIQFGFYNAQRDLCDFKIEKKVQILPRNFEEMAQMERLRAAKSNNGLSNETREYALQMVLGRNWSFVQDVLKKHGLRSVLDPDFSQESGIDVTKTSSVDQTNGS